MAGFWRMAHYHPLDFLPFAESCDARMLCLRHLVTSDRLFTCQATDSLLLDSQLTHMNVRDTCIFNPFFILTAGLTVVLVVVTLMYVMRHAYDYTTISTLHRIDDVNGGFVPLCCNSPPTAFT